MLLIDRVQVVLEGCHRANSKVETRKNVREGQDVGRLRLQNFRHKIWVLEFGSGVPESRDEAPQNASTCGRFPQINI